MIFKFVVRSVASVFWVLSANLASESKVWDTVDRALFVAAHWGTR